MIKRTTSGSTWYNLLPRATQDEVDVLVHCANQYQHLLEYDRWYTWLELSELMLENYISVVVKVLARTVADIYGRHLTDAQQIRVDTVKTLQKWQGIPEYDRFWVRQLQGFDDLNDTAGRIAEIVDSEAYIRSTPYDYSGRGKSEWQIIAIPDDMAGAKKVIDGRLIELGYTLL